MFPFPPSPSPSPSRFIPIFCFRPSFLYKLARKRLLHKLHKGDFVLGYYHTGSFPPSPSPFPSPSSRYNIVANPRIDFKNFVYEEFTTIDAMFTHARDFSEYAAVPRPLNLQLHHSVI